MPTYSPIYKFPSPTAAEASNAPEAFTALGARIERELPTFRGLTLYEREAGLNMSILPTYTLISTSDHAMEIIGWADITAEVAINALSGPGTNIAGTWRILGNGTVLASARWHNYASTGLINSTQVATIAIPAATTNLVVRLEIGADSLSAGAAVQFSRVQVRRYGAPAAG